MIKLIFTLALMLGTTFAFAAPAAAHSKHNHSNAEYCRDFTKKIRINGRTETARGFACRNHNGTWEIVSQNEYYNSKAHKTSFKNKRKYKRNNRRTYVHKYTLHDKLNNKRGHW